jgi:ClpX C4-type zinc finger
MIEKIELMHDTNAEGNDYFKCDFCRRSWAEDRPMVEGHRGSLVCAECLSSAYDAVVNREAGVVMTAGSTAASDSDPSAAACAMCLEARKDPCWRTPVPPNALICLRCIKQSARMLEKDPEVAWRRPAKA